jgi:hypothetical protein
MTVSNWEWDAQVQFLKGLKQLVYVLIISLSNKDQAEILQMHMKLQYTRNKGYWTKVMPDKP